MKLTVAQDKAMISGSTVEPAPNNAIVDDHCGERPFSSGKIDRTKLALPQQKAPQIELVIELRSYDIATTTDPPSYCSATARVVDRDELPRTQRKPWPLPSTSR